MWVGTGTSTGAKSLKITAIAISIYNGIYIAAFGLHTVLNPTHKNAAI